MVNKNICDFTHLNWTMARRSSGSAGSFLKAFEIKNGRKYYYKLSSYDAINGIVGHECINEIVVDRLLSYLNISHLSYRLINARIQIKGKEYETYLCESEDFKKPGDSKVALDVFYEIEAMAGESPLEFCRRMGWEEYVYEMLLVDYLILNRDRHGANIEVLKNKESKTVRLAPLFDHGLSMYFSCYDDKALANVDPTADKRVQCFVGSRSTYDNLNLIPSDKLKKLPDLDENLKRVLFKDLEDAVTDVWIETVWRFLKTRARIYEDFCNHK